MAAATKDITAPERPGNSYGYPVLAGVQIFGRSIVAATAAKALVPAGHGSAVKIVGLAEERYDNRDGATGDLLGRALKGVRRYPVTGATIANVGATVYAADDATLQLTNAGGELAAGKIHGIDAEGVWVEF